MSVSPKGFQHEEEYIIVRRILERVLRTGVSERVGVVLNAGKCGEAVFNVRPKGEHQAAMDHWNNFSKDQQKLIRANEAPWLIGEALEQADKELSRVWFTRILYAFDAARIAFIENWKSW